MAWRKCTASATDPAPSSSPVSPNATSTMLDEANPMATDAVLASAVHAIDAYDRYSPARASTRSFLVADEAVAHARLGDEVAGLGWLGLELAPDSGHVHPQVGRLLLVLRTPHL